MIPNELAIPEAMRDTRRNQGPKNREAPRRAAINVPVSEDQKRIIEEAAIAEGITMSEWVRRAIARAL